MSKSIIERLITLADKHQQADEYISGQYEWDGGACAVGCTIHDAVKLKILPRGTDPGDHQRIAEATDIPEMLWHIADLIFEDLAGDEQKGWTPRFLRAASGGKNLVTAPARIMVRLCRRLANDALNEQIKNAAILNADMWQRRADGAEPTEAEWNAAWRQADAAWRQADAAWHQADAARHQADAARWQADAAWHQADAARWQADAARQQADAALSDAARQQWWSWCADMVCEEMKK